MTPTLLLAATLLLPRHLQDAPPPPPSADEIVVIGERMRRLKLSTKTDRKTGAPICVFRRRSGDPAFDAMMCEAVLREDGQDGAADGGLCRPHRPGLCPRPDRAPAGYPVALTAPGRRPRMRPAEAALRPAGFRA
ncbi:MAG: hypothetical protein ABW182_04655 [Sphingomonas sp.]